MGNRAGRRAQPQPIQYTTTTAFIPEPRRRRGHYGGPRPICPGYGRRQPGYYPQYPGMQPYY